MQIIYIWSYISFSQRIEIKIPRWSSNSNEHHCLRWLPAKVDIKHAISCIRAEVYIGRNEAIIFIQRYPLVDNPITRLGQVKCCLHSLSFSLTILSKCIDIYRDTWTYSVLFWISSITTKMADQELRSMNWNEKDGFIIYESWKEIFVKGIEESKDCQI